MLLTPPGQVSAAKAIDEAGRVTADGSCGDVCTEPDATSFETARGRRGSGGSAEREDAG